jgi:LytS/YehU family sensor histidine kinase
MLLQPLVENALTHGIGPRIGPGRIELTAQREGDALVLGVRDDGVGLPPSAERRERTGIGTTRARLAAMFGEAQRFTLAPAEGGGTEAVVRIPFTPSPAA